jgi:CheY-like chemotaxis protein
VVAQDRGWGIGADDVERGLAGRRENGLVAVPGEDAGEELADRRLVVEDEDPPSRLGRSGLGRLRRGLGLSITYSIVESHRGHITVERPSRGGTGGGASLRVDFPPAPADAPRRTDTPLPVKQRDGESPGVKRTILLVDGDPAVQRTIKALFARDGHDVAVAGDPQHALDLAERGAFDLVITDARAMAPGKRGMLLAEELITRLPALRDRMIVATGDVRPSTEETLARLGVRYVRKPFNLRDLRVEAARLWAATTLS